MEGQFSYDSFREWWMERGHEGEPQTATLGDLFEWLGEQINTEDEQPEQQDDHVDLTDLPADLARAMALGKYFCV